MLYPLNKLINLPVYTKSGENLGKLKEIEIDTNTHQISNYLVKSSQMINRLSTKQLIIKPSQVVGVDKEKMIVEDSVIRQEGLIGEAITS